MRGLVAGVCAALGVFILPAGALAHHPVLAKFDEQSPLALRGLVTSVSWANPHAHIFIEVEDEAGGGAVWAVELASAIDLERSGWLPERLQPGDRIEVQGIAARDGSRQIWGESVVAEGDGEPLFTVSEEALLAPLQGRTEGPTPRWPDGQPRLGLIPGESGYWAFPSAFSLVETGVDVDMDAHGILHDLEDAPRVAPFQTWALDLYRLRQSTYLRDDPLFQYCIPPGGPRQFQNPYGVEFLEDRNRDRIFVLMGGGNRNWRLIYTDGRPHVGQLGGDDDNPLFFGRAVAEWEGDTLVVDTRGFNETFWFSNGGLPHTEQLRLVERISRPDRNTLRYEVTVDDPGAYTRPWTSGWTLQWVEGEEIPEYFCQDNRP